MHTTQNSSTKNALPQDSNTPITYLQDSDRCRDAHKSLFPDGLYKLNLNTTPTTNFARKGTRTLTQWHRTLNHIPTSRLQHASKLLDKIAISDLTECDCSPCALEKSTQRPYTSTSPTSASRPGHTISANTWYETESDRIGNLYYVVFLDHYSLKPFASKTQISTIEIQYLKTIHTQTGKPVVFFQPDNEMGFVSNQVKEYLQSVGGTLKPALPDCHQQNYMAENYHRDSQWVLPSCIGITFATNCQPHMIKFLMKSGSVANRQFPISTRSAPSATHILCHLIRHIS